MIMAFTKGLGSEYMSPSIVFCGFGAAATCNFAFVECWKTLSATGKHADLPSWNWHNEAFMNAVGCVFFLGLFTLPGLVVYILHSIGLSFFSVLSNQREENSATFGIIIYHILGGVLVFIIDTLVILSDTAKLGTFQQRQEKDEDEEDNYGREKKDKDKGVLRVPERGDIEELRAVTSTDRGLAVATLIIHTQFAIDMIIIACANINSGTLVSSIIFAGLCVGWWVLTIRDRNKQTVNESWLLHHRLASILHLFAFLVFFWIALCILLLLEENNNRGFFETLDQLESDRAFLSGFLIFLFFSYLGAYGVILYVHSRSMWSLDEIASLYLASKLTARLKLDTPKY